MTSQKPDLPISACRCARKLILFLFLWFFRSLSSNLLLIFHFCDHVTSWRHVMTSQNLIYLSQLVDVLESWFFFCFYGFLGHWVQICYRFFICVITWRHDVMSWRHKNLIYLSQLVDVLESWFFFCFHGFHVTEFRNLNNFQFCSCYCVMTSCHDVTSILLITLHHLLIL